MSRGAIWSKEAEQSVLGSILLDNMALDAVTGIVSAESFWLPAHRTIFEAMGAMIGKGVEADVVTVADALGENSEAVGGPVYLLALTSSVASARSVKRYAAIVAEKYARRRLLETSELIAELAADGTPIPEALDRIASDLGGIGTTQTRKTPRRLGELLAGALERYEGLAAGDIQSGISTGFDHLDKLLNGGLKPGKLYCIAARPSVGKSSVARAVCIAASKAGYPTLLLSQEMPDEEVADCAIAQVGRVNGSHLQTGGIEDFEWGRLVEAIEIAQDLPLYIEDEGGLTLAQIKAKARGIKGLKVLVLDYLQLCTSTLKGASTNDQVGEISKGLKQLALELGISIVMLSQLNRDVEKRPGKEPVMSDLRDSGNIEQDIDVCLLLWPISEEDEHRIVGWKVDKNRGGKKGGKQSRWAMMFEPHVYAWSFYGDVPSPQAPGRAGRAGGFDG